MATMITMIGTGHVFRIADQVSFIVKYTWPDAVLVELDERRYVALTNDASDKKTSESHSKLYRESAEYQNRISERNGSKPGGELLAAILAGKIVGAEILCIDKDAELIMKEVEEEMSSMERFRYSLSTVTDVLFGRNRINVAHRNFAANEETYIRKMRKRFPTLVRKLIDERNVYMADRIKEASERYKNIVVVVGDAHVRGICELLDDISIDKIRLAEMMDQKSMNNIKTRIWNRKPEESG